MKKLIVLISVLLTCLILFVACGKNSIEPEKTTAADGPETQEEVSSDTSSDNASDICGVWVDVLSQRAALVVTKTDDGKYEMNISWSDSAFVSEEWTMTCAFEEGGYNYSDCVCKSLTFGEAGQVTDQKTLYENGSGRFILEDSSLKWYEGESKEVKCSFELLPDNVGTCTDDTDTTSIASGDDIIGAWVD